MFKRTKPLQLLKIALDTILQNPIIFYPTILLTFVQLLFLEILYFSPRYPLSEFFNPLIRHVWSEDFLHYPMDLVLLPKLFYYVQLLVYLFLGSFLSAVTTHIIVTLNNNHRVILKNSFREAGRSYIHILCYALLSLTLFHIISSSYSTIVNAFIGNNKPIFVNTWITKILIFGTPYFQFSIGIIVTTLLTYIIPIIIIDKKKIFSALILNFKVLSNSFKISLIVVLLPTILYFPVLVARNNISYLISHTLPEIQIFIIIVGILITALIDLIILSAITINYLVLKESK